MERLGGVGTRLTLGECVGVMVVAFGFATTLTGTMGSLATDRDCSGIASWSLTVASRYLLKPSVVCFKSFLVVA